MANKEYSETFRHEREIVLRGTPVVAEFYFYPGYPPSADEPGAYDEIELDKVLVDEIDVLHLMSASAVSELEAELYKIYDEREEGI